MVKSESAVNISNILRKCIDELILNKKTVCSICSDNFSSNKTACKIKNLQKKNLQTILQLPLCKSGNFKFI